MIARANHFRAEASLPPLLGDAHLTQASENHSRYGTLNPPPPADQPLSYHNETPGAPGFTGVDRAHRSGPRSGTLDGNRWPRATHLTRRGLT